jgi:intraflagellar transport protein 80
VRLAGGVDAFAWSESGDGLVAASKSGAVTAWHCACAVFVDPDLVRTTKSVAETTARGDGLVIERFDGNRVTIRGGDGAICVSSVYGQNGTFFPTLHADCENRQWDRAIRLCRFVRDDSLWACLAARAVAVDELEPAAIAYAALEQIEKVRFIEKARATPNVARRAADLAAFKREPEEAERILLGAGLVFRAIELNLRLFDWDRALEIALDHKTHIDTVLCFRAAYLKRSGRREDKKDFVAAAREVEVSEERVRMKMAQEREREKNMPPSAAREATKTGTVAKEQGRVASSKAKPGAAKASAAARPAGTRTGSTRSR